MFVFFFLNRCIFHLAWNHTIEYNFVVDLLLNSDGREADSGPIGSCGRCRRNRPFAWRGCTWKRGYGYGTLRLVHVVDRSTVFIYQYCWKTARNRWLDHLLYHTWSTMIYLFSVSVNIFREFPMVSPVADRCIKSPSSRARCCTWQKMPTCRGSWPQRCWRSVRTRQAAILTMGFHFLGDPVRCFFEWNILLYKMDDLGVLPHFRKPPFQFPGFKTHKTHWISHQIHQANMVKAIYKPSVAIKAGNEDSYGLDRIDLHGRPWEHGWMENILDYISNLY